MHGRISALRLRRPAAEEALATAEAAGAAVAEQLPRLLAPEQSAGVRQAALAALGGVARAAGRERPALVLAALPAALAATRDAQRSVRSSALAAVAACAAALGTRALPQLLPLVTAVLAAVEAAGKALAAAIDAPPAEPSATPTDAVSFRSFCTLLKSTAHAHPLGVPSNSSPPQ